MIGTEPVAELDERFSSDGARATVWAEASWQLEGAEVFWLSTVRPDGRPHVTPVLAVWLDGAAYFCTGPTERKARNLATNPFCILTTGSNALDRGLDVVVEGEATGVRDDAELRAVAAEYLAKYGHEWAYAALDGAINGDAGAGSEALVYRMAPTRAYGFTKGRFSQTRWRFDDPRPTEFTARP